MQVCCEFNQVQEVKKVRKDIHPEYTDTKFKCSCGNVIETKSTSGEAEVSVEVCSKCHPFFTGQQRFVDTGGRIGKFKKRWNQE